MSENNRREVAEAIAAEKGLEIMEPLDDEVFLDLDSPAAMEAFERAYTLVAGDMVVSRMETVSKGGNTHVYLEMNRILEPMERIALQAALGSDGKKEYLSIRRQWEGTESPVLLFETPAAAHRIEKWRKKRGVDKLPPVREDIFK